MLWTEEAVTCVRRAAKAALSGVPWIAFDPAQKARVQTRITPDSISTIMLQQDPENSRRWLPVQSWGRMITLAERQQPVPMIEALALQEGLFKMKSHATTSQKLEVLVSPQLQALLKIAHRAHPKLQATLVDISCY